MGVDLANDDSLPRTGKDSIMVGRSAIQLVAEVSSLETFPEQIPNDLFGRAVSYSSNTEDLV